MIKRFFLPILLLFVFISQAAFAQSQIGISGAINDSFEKDFRNTPFPRDRNANIITEKELLDNLPKETSAETVYVSSFDITGNRVINKKELLLAQADSFSCHVHDVFLRRNDSYFPLDVGSSPL